MKSSALIYAICAGIAGGIAVFALANLPSDKPLAIHWNFAGVADRFVPPAIALSIFPAGLLGLAIVAWFGDKTAFFAARKIVLHSCLAGGLIFGQVWIARGSNAGIFINFGIAAYGFMLTLLGAILPGLQPSRSMGIRTRWSLSNPANWRASNRVGGLFFIVAGIIAIGASMFNLAPIVRMVLLICPVILAALASVVFSWAYAKRQR